MQCWIRILGLPQEYWRPKILFSIARGIGTPLSLDDATTARTLGHYARVLVDVDPTGDLCDQILVERHGFAFFVGIEYERLPAFCPSCKLIGHSIDNCKHSTVKAKNTDLDSKEGRNDPVAAGKTRQKYVPKNKEDPNGNPVLNSRPEQNSENMIQQGTEATVVGSQGHAGRKGSMSHS